MVGLITNRLFPHSRNRGTLLTPEQAEEISSRIAQRIADNISKQLEKALASSSKDTDEQNSKF